MGRSLTILHISDLHIKNGDSYDRDIILTSLIEYVNAREMKPDIIFATGDITFSGKSTEYAQATRFFNELLAVAELDKARLYVIPGNHDVNRAAGTYLIRSLTDEWASDRYFASASVPTQDGIRRPFVLDDDALTGWEAQPHFAKLAAYREWYDQFFNGIRGFDSRSTCQLHEPVFVEGVQLNILAINSTLFCQDERDRGLLWIGRRCIEAEIAKLAATRAGICVALIHHPLDWLHPAETAYVEIALKNHFDLIFRGHLNNRHTVSETQSGVLFLATGASYPPRWFSKSAFVVELDVDDRITSVTPIHYIENPRQRWALDTSQFEENDHYVGKFPLRLIQGKGFLRDLPSQYASNGSLRASLPHRIDRVEFTNFRNLRSLSINLSRPSTLGGRWTCVAGVNGAGKTSTLQGICMALLGEPRINDIGSALLRRMRRRDGDEQFDASVGLTLSRGQEKFPVKLHIVNGGVESDAGELGEDLRLILLLAYGASRNLSDYRDNRYANLSVEVQRLMTLFDPLAQLVSAEHLIAEHVARGSSFILFKTLANSVFGDDLRIGISEGAVLFTHDSTTTGAMDLPDGFRSSIAWMADLCNAWCEKNPERAESADLSEIEAIVLIDEIDLHLHPALQRTLVPKLRAALPQVQWIVTTHSPLVLSSFDANEIVALDSAEPTGLRTLDRQIMGFTTDEIYSWLMGTAPTSEALEQLLDQHPHAALSGAQISHLLTETPKVSVAQASRKIRERSSTIKRLAQ